MGVERDLEEHGDGGLQNGLNKHHHTRCCLLVSWNFHEKGGDKCLSKIGRRKCLFCQGPRKMRGVGGKSGLLLPIEAIKSKTIVWDVSRISGHGKLFPPAFFSLSLITDLWKDCTSNSLVNIWLPSFSLTYAFLFFEPENVVHSEVEHDTYLWTGSKKLMKEY